MNTRNGLDSLTAINIEDMLEALGLEKMRWGRTVIERACRPVARRFAEQIKRFDQIVGEEGLVEGARWLLRSYVTSVEVAGLEHIPVAGPLLIVSNHPGLVDTVSLFASLPRRDLRIVVTDRPFLRELPNTSKYLIYLRSEEKEQTGALRKITGHLRRGGAILLFPGGQIEPDPAITGKAAESLGDWSKSIGLILRLATTAQVLPAIVSGVVSAPAHNNPITRFRKTQKDRERLAALLQVIVPAYRGVKVRVAFGSPLSAAHLVSSSDDTEAITEKVVSHARRLLEAPPKDWRLILSR